MPSARCSAAQVVRFGRAVLRLALVASLPTLALAQAPWFEVTPNTPAEGALRALVESGASLDAAELIARVDAFSSSRAGTPESGLAQLWAGQRLLARDRPATAHLTHPDIARTAIVEHAWLGLARARLREGAFSEAAALFERVSAASTRDGTNCRATRDGAEAEMQDGKLAAARDGLARALSRCPRDQRAPLLLKLARTLERLGESADAARTYDRLDREHPVSAEAGEGAARLAALARLLPEQAPAHRADRALGKARAQLRAGRSAQAVRTLQPQLESGPRVDAARVLAGRAEIARRRFKTAAGLLSKVPPTSPHAAEAGFQLAVARAGRGDAVAAYEEAAVRLRGTTWGELALFSLGNHFQKDALDERAFPYYRRVLEEYENGDYLIRATWRVGWREYRNARWSSAAEAFEGTAARRPDQAATGIFLYWAARAHLQLGAVDRAVELLEQVVVLFKHTYHGLKATELLGTLGRSRRETASPEVRAAPLPDAVRTRYRQMMLIEMLVEAREELSGLRNTRTVEATRARVDVLRGDYSAGIRAMARAYPEYLGEAGGGLSREVWTTLFPLPFADSLVARARGEDVDPALVAGLIRQESTFDPAAVSSAGARGLMQLMPATGRVLARTLGIRYATGRLHDAETNMRMGIRYLRDLLKRFDGRVDHALAAYNAGPHRVVQWKARYPGLTTEEFVETIPFTQTRLYVRKVLANRLLYRRLYPNPASQVESVRTP